MQVTTENTRTDRPRVNILGVGVHAINMEDTVRILEDAVERSDRGYVCLCSVHGIMEAHRDPELCRIFDRALLVAPDGAPTVWLGRLQGMSRMSRVFGPSLMLELCRSSVAKRYTHFLYGGNSGVAKKLKHNLERMFPGIRIVGTYTPPFRQLNRSEERDVRNLFTRLRPDITWVGLSTPKQDRFMAEYIAKFETKVMIGVGAAFDMHTGRIRDCPAWMKPLGLQWVHRLAQEPSRLWYRYLHYNPLFLYHVALQLAGVRRYHTPSTQEHSLELISPRHHTPPESVPSVSGAAEFEQRAS